MNTFQIVSTSLAAVIGIAMVVVMARAVWPQKGPYWDEDNNCWRCPDCHRRMEECEVPLIYRHRKKVRVIVAGTEDTIANLGN